MCKSNRKDDSDSQQSPQQVVARRGKFKIGDCEEEEVETKLKGVKRKSKETDMKFTS